ncbi:MAG: acyl-CoA/acyl-ACP dehydrogenase [Candidatus Sphingomonas phytovorans]|nr:acyl-CoA dehydrogenase family protein [Sphingomonas sp.]WEK02246.1 MAG: acyl-CoA/acyl-ACP dehydrogenase [Sphingomonas sp.]
MNFDYTADQVYLKGEVRRFLEDRCSLPIVRQTLDPANTASFSLWQEVVAQGWLGAAIPEAHGGLGLGHVDLCAIFEELGRALAPVPFASTILFAEALLLAGSDEQKERYLAKVAAGGIVATVAIAEGPGPAVPSRLSAAFIGGRLSGTKTPVADAVAAQVAIVLADGVDGPVLVLLELDDATVARAPLTVIDPTRPAAALTFDQAPGEILGLPGTGNELARQVLDRAAAFAAFEQIGGADHVLERTCAYALERRAFGRPLGANQAIKHKLADIYIKNQVARSNAYYAAWALGDRSGALAGAAAAARIAGCEAYWQAAKESIQVFGGIGVTWEEDAHLFYRRAAHLSVVAGAPRYWRDRLATTLIDQH